MLELQGVSRNVFTMSALTQIRYAVETLATVDSGQRLPRAQQSAGAARLLDGLTEGAFHPVAVTKSHSRTGLAAASGNAPGLRLGIDIEWMAPDRPFDAIAQSFLPIASAPIGMAEFYRGWTFFEAYFKAFQRFPRAELVAEIATRASDDRVHALVDKVWMLQRRVLENFQLCLVWTHATSEMCLATDYSKRA